MYTKFATVNRQHHYVLLFMFDKIRRFSVNIKVSDNFKIQSLTICIAIKYQEKSMKLFSR